MKMSDVKSMVMTAMCIALGVVLPVMLHGVENAGNIFCPMHIPVLICGLVCGWQYGLVCGIVTPVLSSLLTGMPPVAILPAMIIELAVYGLIASVMMGLVKTKKPYVDLYISLIVAMLVGRVINGVVKAIMLAGGDYSIAVWATASFVTCLPAIVIQLVFIPNLIHILTKAKILLPRYKESENA